VRRALHQQGTTDQGLVLTVSSPDPEYEQKRAAIWDLQRRTEAGEIDLYFEDEVDLAGLPGVPRCWSKQGQQCKIEMPRQNKKHYGTGLIQWVSGQLYWEESWHKDNALFRSVLSQLVPGTGSPDTPPSRKQYVVVDTYRIHFAKPVQAWSARYADEVKVVYLPASSPNRQPVERFWKHVLRRVTHHQLFQSMDRLMEAVCSFFRDMAASPAVIRQVAGLAA